MRSHATPAASGPRRPPRHRPGEMIALFARGTTLRPCLPVVAVVGCVLSAINEGARIASGITKEARVVAGFCSCRFAMIT